MTAADDHEGDSWTGLEKRVVDRRCVEANRPARPCQRFLEDFPDEMSPGEGDTRSPQRRGGCPPNRQLCCLRGHFSWSGLPARARFRVVPIRKSREDKGKGQKRREGPAKDEALASGLLWETTPA